MNFQPLLTTAIEEVVPDDLANQQEEESYRNPYEISFDPGNVSISGDSFLGESSRRYVPPQSFQFKKPLPPSRPIASSSSSSSGTSQTGTTNKATKPADPPKNAHDLFKRFHRPFITSEGFNLDNYRADSLSERIDPKYRINMRSIIEHRDQIRQKFAKMQSANSITNIMYFEKPLDPKYFVDLEEDKKKKKKPVKKQSFKDFWKAKQEENRRASQSNPTSVKAMFSNATFASLFEKYAKPKSSSNKENRNAEFIASTSNNMDKRQGSKRSHPEPVYNFPGNEIPEHFREVPPEDVERELERVSYFNSMMHHYINYGTAPPVEETMEVDPVQEEPQPPPNQKRRVTFDETYNREFSPPEDGLSFADDQRTISSIRAPATSFSQYRNPNNGSMDESFFSVRSRVQGRGSSGLGRPDLNQSFASVATSSVYRQDEVTWTNGHTMTLTMDMSQYKFYDL